MAQEKEFFHFVQFLRGGAAILVICCHLMGWWLLLYRPSASLLTMWNQYFVIPLNLYNRGGYLGVLTFFLISGFVTAHASRNESCKKFLIKRFFRIVPTFVLVLIMTFIIANISVNIGIDLPLGTESIEIKDYVMCFFFLDHIMGTPSVIGATWTLFVEVLFYIIMAMSLSKLKNDPLRGILFTIGEVIIMILLAPMDTVFLKIANFVVYVLYILIGVVIYYGYKNIISIYQTIILGGTCFFLYVQFYEYLYPEKMFGKLFPMIYSSLFAIIVFLLAMATVNKKNIVMNFIGNISYQLYLMHLPIGCLTLNTLISSGMVYKYAVPCAFIISIACSYFIYKCWDKPLQKILAKFTIRCFKN